MEAVERGIILHRLLLQVRQENLTVPKLISIEFQNIGRILLGSFWNVNGHNTLHKDHENIGPMISSTEQELGYWFLAYSFPVLFFLLSLVSSFS